MRFVLALFALLFLSENYAQNYELDKVTIEELSEKAYPGDTSVAAAYIFKDRIITYNRLGRVVNITRVKLKIYKKEGYDYANIAQVFSKGREAVFSDVVTYNLVDGKVVKTKLGKEGEFTDNLGDDIFEKKITMPDVKEGSVIEYKLISYENNLSRPVNFYFQEEIPIKAIILTIEYPESLSYNKNLSGSLSPSLRAETLSDHIDVRSLKKRDNYQLLNVPALIDEGYVNNINNYRSRIQYELASAEMNTYTENIATDWKTITRNIYKLEDFGEQLSTTGYFEKELDQELLNKDSRNDTINAVLAFVKEKVKWSGDYGVVCDKGVRKAYKEKLGNTADINLMLTTMLQHAGYAASPVLITTRSRLLNPFPSLKSHNYVICGVEVGDDVILLDATSQYSLPNILPIRNLNFFGKIVRKNGTWEELDIMPKANSEEVINIIATLNPNGEISGKVRDKYADYNALIYRETLNDITNEGKVEKLERKYSGIEVADFEVKNASDLTQPLTEEYSFTTSKNIEIIGDKIYFSPMLFFARTENPFKQENREYPVDFIYPNQTKFYINITIPEGYRIEALPESKAFKMPNSLAGFKYTISGTGDKIQLQSIFDINQAVIGSEYYMALKNFFKEIVAKQTEKVVLKKV